MSAREEARRLWEQSGGVMPLADIAAQLGTPLSTTKSWKRRDAWGKDEQTQKDASAQDAFKTRQRQRRAQVNRKAVEALEANEELSERERDFCAAFVHAPNPSQAAMATGRYSTYHSARQAAYAMMQRPEVQAEIKRLKAVKRITLLADADDIIDLHMRIAFADLTQFVEFGQEEVPVVGMFGPVIVKDPETGEEKPLTKDANVVRLKDHTQVDGTVLSEIRQGRDSVSVKLADRQKSLDFLERLFELDPMNKHKKDYDRRRLELEERKAAEGNEDALEKLDEIMSGVDRGMLDDGG